jgi:DNA repair photolyase
MEFINAVHIIHNTPNEGWFGTTHNMNIYKGCNQGCIYCDSRSSCYQIKEFDRVKVKRDVPQKVAKELEGKRKKGVISLGGMSDPYNHLEEKLQYTRSVLEEINKHQFGVSCITKNKRIIRDFDLYQKINQHSLVNIGVTITTFDDRLQGRIERNVSSSSERFNIIKQAKDKGLYAGILMMPILPFINDTPSNIKAIVEQAHLVGADYIYPSFGVTLRDNQRQYFFHKIGEELTKKYIKEFKDSYMCLSPNVKQLKKVFIEECTKYGIAYKMEDIVQGAKNHIKRQQLSFDW